MSIWYALAVTPQREMSVVGDVLGDGFEAFTPFEVYRSCRHNRFIDRDRPLLPGYVMAKARAGLWAVIRRHRHVRTVVGFGNNPAVIPQGDIDLLRSWTTGLQRQMFEIGDRAEVVCGPLKGDYVTVSKVIKNRVRVLYVFLGAARQIQMPAEWLRSG